MALNKDMIKGGQTFSYHMIDDLKISRLNKSITITILHYKDRAFRLSNPKEYISRDVVTLRDTDGNLYNSIIGLSVFELYVLAYSKLKESKLQPKIDPQTGRFLTDEDGSPVMEESNFYHDAVDVLETEDLPQVS